MSKQRKTRKWNERKEKKMNGKERIERYKIKKGE